jgi:hypothetical protein
MRELHDRYLALRLDSQALAAAHPGMPSLRLDVTYEWICSCQQVACMQHWAGDTAVHAHVASMKCFFGCARGPGYGFATTFVRPTLWTEPFPASVALEPVLPEDGGAVGFREVPLSEAEVCSSLAVFTCMRS